MCDIAATAESYSALFCQILPARNTPETPRAASASHCNFPPMNSALQTLNSKCQTEAREILARCCGATPWTSAVAGARPFADEADLNRASEAAFGRMEKSDWLEAFEHHPRIGDVDALRAKFATLNATKQWAGGEQAGARDASEQTLSALAQGNRDYEAKFGFLFIVCATGKSADEMLALLRARLPNDAEGEWRIAAEEQKKITRLRLAKLLAD